MPGNDDKAAYTTASLSLSVAGYPDEIIFTGETQLYRKAIRSELVRPAMGGVSIGPVDGKWAGTLASVVYDSLTHERLFLSNWHVLAFGDAPIGLPIQQPGRPDMADGHYILGELYRYATIKKPSEGVNLVDAAIGRPFNQNDLSDDILNIGRPDHITEALEGMEVVMSGRDGFYEGVVMNADASMVVKNYPWGSAAFVHQIEIEPGIPNGDSGMLVISKHDKGVVGLAFAGNDEFTLANHASDVAKVLGIDW